MQIEEIWMINSVTERAAVRENYAMNIYSCFSEVDCILGGKKVRLSGVNE